MSYTIDYLDDKKIVQVEVNGRVNFKTAKLYSTEAIKLAHEYKCKKFLFNHLNTKLETGVYKIHTDGVDLENFGFISSNKIAIAVSRGKNDSHFSAPKVSNVKWSNIKYFNTSEKAIHWLMEDE